jgi:carboxy-cis,cis-muconate cyclase
MLHHLMVGTWTPPGAIFTFEFDDESLTLNLVQRTSINHNEPISWMTFDVSLAYNVHSGLAENEVFMG